MRDIIVYVLIAIIYRVESRTFCGDKRCVCSNKDNELQISCLSNPNVLKAKYSLPDTVKILNLSRNNLTRVERSPSLASETLKQLLLVNNRINEIDIDAFILPSLEVLDLSHNQLEFIHRDTFATIKNLIYLSLADNKFSAFGNLNFYHLKTLRNIVLDNNDIGPSLQKHSLFEGGYELTNDVQSISLNNVQLNSDNKKCIFVTSLDHRPNYDLKNLSLAQNNLTEIIDLHPSLLHLDISSNPVKEIPENVFYDSKHLIELKLNDILIEEVPDNAFSVLNDLRHLELDNNTRLNKISPLAWGSEVLKNQTDISLESISLKGAKLSSLDAKLERVFTKIHRVDLRDNPWSCDCQLSWLQNIQIPNEFIDFRCSTPQRLHNRRVIELQSNEFVCEKVSLETVNYVRTIINVTIYCALLVVTILMIYFFIFSPKPFMYRHLKTVEFPRTP